MAEIPGEMRKPRHVIPNCPHHIIHRGNNRRRLFSYPRDYKQMLWKLADAAARTRCKVHAICLMANHLHAIVTPPRADSLSNFVHSFAGRYATYRNDQREGSGKLFEERFWSEPIKTVFHLAAATMYIERNPVAAGVKDEAAAYRWSSFRLHAEVDVAPEKQIAGIIVPSNWYSSLGRTNAERAARYSETFELYSQTALAREQCKFYSKYEGTNAYSRRLERPNRVSAREAFEVSRYSKKPL